MEGWELGAITVGMVLGAALLTVPRAATPGLFPVPLLDVVDANASRAREAERVRQAEREGLPFETRAVGDAVRRLGLSLSRRDGDAEHFQRLIEERVQLALAAGQHDGLLRLRAVQAQLFARAVRAHHFGTPPSEELSALGGDFVERALANAWAGPAGALCSDDELVNLFERRWTELAHLQGDPRFKPTLGEVRRYFRFLLLHPERHGDTPLASVRLRYVEALARKDTEYPLDLARGSLLAELGAMPQSAEALNRHLAQVGRATWNLRARNYLLYVARGPAELAGP